MNFDTRKHLVEYDNVMNAQRAIIYEERHKVLTGADTRGNIETYIRELIDKGVEAHCEGRHPENWDLEGLIKYLSTYFPLAPGTVIPQEALQEGRPGLVEFLYRASVGAYDGREQQLSPELMRQVERFVMLKTIDAKWIDYLTHMEHLKEGIGLRGYGQRDPLVEYKNEAFVMFNELTEAIQAEIVTAMFHVQVKQQEPAPTPQRVDRAAQASGPGQPPGKNGGGKRTPVAVGAGPEVAKVGRNDPCPCGSGLKYKRCHGR
jgi:preprotein translocase subunit SecA